MPLVPPAKVPFDAESYDRLGEFAGGTFTASNAGFYLVGVAVTVEDTPSRIIRLEGGALGLYEGTPIGQRGTDYTMALPDKITVYRRPLLAACNTQRELRDEIRLTVLHEIGHYFGIEDAELPF